MKKKNWLITGISSGLGKALAEAVMDFGDFVIGTFRKPEQVEAFNKINEGRGLGILLDVTDFDQIENTISQLENNMEIDVLVNNAGTGIVGAIEESSIKEVRHVFEANFFGALKMTQTILPFMRKRKKGNIIQISSHGGVKAFGGFGVYNASKFALEGFSEALAQEVASLGIHVTIVEPGPFRTNFAGDALILAEKVIEDYNDTAGAFRAKLKGVHNKQEGHPEKAAMAIINHVNKEKSTLRLPLGKIPMITIGMKIDSLKADLEANKEVSEQCVY